jgi:hypothetical protein
LDWAACGTCNPKSKIQNRKCRAVLALTASLAIAAAAAQSPSSAPNGPVAFQPGVWIDWRQHEVQVLARVVLRSGPLEFLACWSGKEHESILRCEAAAVHVYMALGLIGVQPGHPPIWNPQTESYHAPTGDLVEIALQWQADGQTHTADAYTWLRELEYDRPPIARPWVFAGSQRSAAGALASDTSGIGVALVDFPDSLICLSRRYSSQNAELWVAANTTAIPSVGTPVRMILRPARARAAHVELDFRGDVWLDGQWCALADLADVITLVGRLDAEYRQQIHVRGTLRSDVAHLQETLRGCGVPAEAYQFVGSKITGLQGLPAWASKYWVLDGVRASQGSASGACRKYD